MNAKKSFHKLGLTLITFLFFVGGSIAQEKLGSISGTVLNADSKKPIALAVVKISNEEKPKWVKTLKSDKLGKFEFKDIPTGKYYFTVAVDGYAKYRKSHVEVIAGKNKEITATMKMELEPIIALTDEVTEVEMSSEDNSNNNINVKRDHSGYRKESKKMKANYSYSTPNNSGAGSTNSSIGGYDDQQNHNTESYAAISENGFKASKVNPLSTFSVDVDAASYSNCRRFIMSGQKPEKGAVRVEEMINYFNYDYPDPEDEHPFSITTEIGECPWSENKLFHIGLQGERIEKDNLPSSNLALLLDVSGSMNQANKLPLLKKSFRLLVDELGPKDKISMVVYAGAAGLVLKPTAANNSTAILEALDNLRAGGSTAGGAGIKLAYKVAQENFIVGGNNRVILATDGDFNIGMSSDGSMQELIEEKRKTGIFLTCLGFGTGNYKDSKMETLADKGNGNYAYIDNIFEAKKVLVTEIGATLITLAKDVKIQVEFNPSVIESYRLVGYENRLLNEEDFNDDTKDAGEIGAGHSVTALYEVVLKGEGDGDKVDPLKYQSNDITKASYGNEMLTVKFRYKAPDGNKSKLIERILENKILEDNKLSKNFMFSAAVAEFGMILRDSEHKGTATLDHVIQMATDSKGKDKNGYRAEFIRLADAAKVLYK